MKQVILKIYGEVQGVGLRYRTARIASELNLTGWAKNENNGTVKVLAQGEEKDLNKLIFWIKNNANFARVERLEERWGEVEEKFKDFEIRYG
jgi:acylphosphatase